MATVDGVWDCEVKTPFGMNKSELIIRTDGDKLLGESIGAQERVPLLDGTVNGETLRWRIELQKPFPMKLKVEAKLDGDVIEGVTSVGAFAKSKLRATRRV